MLCEKWMLWLGQKCIHSHSFLAEALGNEEPLNAQHIVSICDDVAMLLTSLGRPIYCQDIDCVEIPQACLLSLLRVGCESRGY